MTDETNNGSSGAMAFILGGVVVALAVLGWVVLGGSVPTDEPDISIEVPGVGTVEGDVESN